MRFSRRLFLIGFAAWVLLVTAAYLRSKNIGIVADRFFDILEQVFAFSRYPRDLSFSGRLLWFGQYAWSLLTVLLLLVASLPLGRRLRRLLDGPSGPEASLFPWSDLALGLGTCSLFLYGLGLAGLLFTGPVLAAGLFLIVFFFLDRPAASFPVPVPTHADGQDPWPPWFRAGALGVMVLAGLSNLFGSLAPERFYDSLVYHVTVPAVHVMRHKVTDIPSNFFSHYPMGLSMLYGLGELVRGEFSAKFLHFLLGVGCVLLLLDIGERRLHRGAGWLAALLFCTIPIVQVSAWEATVDLGMVFFLLAGVRAYLGRDEAGGGGGTPYAAALLCGFAFAVKYNSVFWSGPLFLLAAWEELVRRRVSPALFLRRSVLLAGCFLAPAAVYWAKSLILTGNPLFPYLGSLLGTGSMDPSRLAHVLGEQHERWATTLWQYLVLPWTQMIRGDTGDSMMGPLLLLFLPAAVCLKGRPADFGRIAALLLLSYLLWLTQTHILRFFLAGLALACLVCADSAARVLTRRGWFTAALLTLVLFLSCFNLYSGLTMLWSNVDPWGVALGLESREAYLVRKLMNTYTAAADWANRSLSAGSRVLVVGDARGYYLDLPFEASTAYDHNPLVTAIARSRDLPDLRRLLRQHGFTHLLYNGQEALRLQFQYNIFPFEPRDFRILKEFWEKHLVPEFSSGGLALYRLEWERPTGGGRLAPAFLPSLRAGYFLQQALQSLESVPDAGGPVPDGTRRLLEQSLQEYDKALAAGDISSGHYNNMAVACIRLDRLKDALTYAAKAVEMDPANAEAHKNLAELHQAAGRHRDALRHLQRACELAPGNDHFRERLRALRGY